MIGALLGHLPAGLSRLTGPGVGGCQLLVGGMLYDGWTSVEVSRTVREMAGQFSLEVSERWSAGQGGPSALLEWRIQPGDPCTLIYYGVPVVTGYVDVYNPRYTATSHEVQIQGRSKTGDACDCSAERPTSEWTNATLPQIAEEMGGKFGLGVEIEADDIARPFDKVRIEQGESVHELVDRLARQRGVWPTDTPRGNLRLLQVKGGGAFSLVEGVNILEGAAQLRADTRHSKITTKGQKLGSDQSYGREAAEVEATAEDDAVRRYRPLVVVGEEVTDKATARDRADQEGAARGGESVRATIKVQDWWQAPGKLWAPGDVGDLISPMLAIERDMAIEAVKLRLDQRGTIAELSLVAPEALNPKTTPKLGGGKGKSNQLWLRTRPKKAE